jgi:GTP-binding protein
MRHSLTAKPTAASAQGEARTRTKRALSWTHTARFLTTAGKLADLPVTELPEVAFVGRSNAGKSTAINALAQQKRLAFASKTPGRTQHINLFALGPKDAPDALFADLPGYGYAAVERGAKLRWQAMMAEYLAVRRNLTGIVLLVDVRHGFTDLDRRLVEFVAARIANGSVALMTLLTKADKLGKREVDRAVGEANRFLEGLASEAADVSLAAFSAFDAESVGAVALAIRARALPSSDVPLEGP